jgi:hypothetical protein
MSDLRSNFRHVDKAGGMQSKEVEEETTYFQKTKFHNHLSNEQ